MDPNNYFKYFKSFLDLTDQVFHDLDLPPDLADSKKQGQSMLKSSKFRKKFLDNIGKCVDSVKFMAPYLLKGLVKPQHLIEDHSDYYMAIDMATQTAYICFKNLLMIDIDFYKDASINDVVSDKDEMAQLTPKMKKQKLYQKTIEVLKKKCPKGYKFRIYGTRNGIHAFLVSQPMNPKSSDAIKLQLDIGSDFYYVVYSYLRGWSVRLNRKQGETDPNLYQYLGEIGDGDSNKELVKLVNLHIDRLKDWEETDVISLMRGG